MLFADRAMIVVLNRIVTDTEKLCCGDFLKEKLPQFFITCNFGINVDIYYFANGNRQGE